MSGKHEVKEVEIDDLPTEAARRGSDNDTRVVQALDRQSNQLLPGLVYGKERRLVQQHLIGELAQGFEHRRQALGMALETRLHSIREACNHVLVTGKTHLRQQRLEYFGEVYQQVEQRMNALADEFLLDMDQRFGRLDRFSNERIRAREQQRLEKSVDDFLDTVDHLMEEFRSIISENVDHTGGPA